MSEPGGFLEPWDEYPYGTVDLSQRWDVPVSTNVVTFPTINGPAVHWDNVLGIKIMGTSENGWRVSFPFYFTGGDVRILFYSNGLGNNTGLNCGYLVPNNGFIGFYIDGLGGPLAAVSTKPVPYNTWVYLTFTCGQFYTCDQPPAAWRVCMNNEIILEYGGGGRTASPYVFPDAPMGNCYKGWADRVYILATTNDLGFIEIQPSVDFNCSLLGWPSQTTYCPNTNGSINQYSVVGAPDAATAVCSNDGDTSYIENGTFNEEQTFTLDVAACPSGTTVIRSVIAEIVARKDNTDPRSVVPILDIGGTIYKGANFPLTQSYQIFDYTWKNNPATGLPFTLAEINALEWGVETA